MNFESSFKLTLRLVQMIGLVVLILHWVACVWNLIVVGEYDTRSVIWVPPMDLNAGVTDFFEDKTTKMQSYVISFYYAILMVTGNEMAPRT